MEELPEYYQEKEIIMLNKTVRTTKQLPVKVLQFKWYPPVTHPSLYRLPCSACRKQIGQKRWGIAMTEEQGSMRLCEACSVKAKQALKG